MDENQEIRISFTADLGDTEKRLDSIISKLQQIKDMSKFNINFGVSGGVGGSRSNNGYRHTSKTSASINKAMRNSAPAYTDIERHFAREADLKSAFGTSTDLVVQSSSFAKTVEEATQAVNDFSIEVSHLKYSAEGMKQIPDYIDAEFKEVFDGVPEGQKLLTMARPGTEHYFGTNVIDNGDYGENIRDTSAAVDYLNNRFAATMIGANALMQPLRALGDVTSTVGNTIGNAASIIGKSFINALKAVGNALKKVGGAIKSFAKSSIDRLTSRVKNATKGVSQLFSSFKRIAMYRALRSMIKAITDGFKEGTENAYRWAVVNNNQLAKSLDSIKTESSYLKNSIGAMVAPIINALVPAIEVAVSAVVDFINVLNQLFAIIGGQSTWIKANKQARSFGENLKSAGGAAKSLTAGIDELNILSESSGGGGADLDYSSMFEEVEVGSSKLKDALENGEWMRFGSLLADSLNDAIANFDAQTLGLNIGSKIENAIEVAYGFLKRSDTKTIGTKLAEFLNYALKAIDTNLLGKTLAEMWNRVFDLWLNFVSDFGWEDLGTKIVDGITGFFTNFKPETVADAIQQTIHGVATTLGTIIENFPHDEIQASIKAFFDKLDPEQLGTDIFGTLSDAVGFALDSLNNILKSIHDAATSGAFETFVQATFDAVDWTGLGIKLSILLLRLVQDAFDLYNAAFRGIVKSILGDEFFNEWEETQKRRGHVLAEDNKGILASAIETLEQLQAEHEKSCAENYKTSEEYGNSFKRATEEVLDATSKKVAETNNVVSDEWLKAHKNIESSNSLIKADNNSTWAQVYLSTKTNAQNAKTDSSNSFKDAQSNIAKYNKSLKEDNASTWSSVYLATSANAKATEGSVSSCSVNAENAMSTGNKNILKDTEKTWTGEGSATNTIKNGCSDIQDASSQTSTNVAKDFGDMSSKFSKATKDMGDDCETLGDKIRGIWNSVVNFLEDVSNKIHGNEAYDTSMNVDYALGFEHRASGGFMESGQLYSVREGGIPEYVGRYGTRAAVANNEQIVDGIAYGVADANENVVAAIDNLINVVQGLNLQVNIGDKEIGQANERYANERGVYVNSGAFAGAY